MAATGKPKKVMTIVPPNERIKERITAFGHAGAGKSSLIFQILRRHKSAHAYIIDLDYSYAYERIMMEEYPELGPDGEDRVHIYTIDQDWEEFVDTFKEVLKEGDEDDWLVIDPATATWQMVQSWFSDQVHGVDIGKHMVRLRKESKDIKEFNKELSTDMTWPVINKVYQDGFYRNYRKWKGHTLICCEAVGVRKDADQAEKAEYGFIGQKPAGQKTLPYIGATNLYLDHPKADVWRYTTTKDRARELQEKVEFDKDVAGETFADRYLIEVAGWDLMVMQDEG